MFKLISFCLLLHLATADFDCSKRTNGIYGDSKDCSSFIICSAGNAITQQCPPPLLFNSVILGCDWQQNVECYTEEEEQHPATKAPPSNSAPVNCAGKPDGLHRNPSNCHSFYQCSNGLRYEFLCPDNLVYNPSIERCDFLSESNQCQEDGGNLPTEPQPEPETTPAKEESTAGASTAAPANPTTAEAEETTDADDDCPEDPVDTTTAEEDPATTEGNEEPVTTAAPEKPRTTEAEEIPETTEADDECPEDPETTLADDDPATTEGHEEPVTTAAPEKPRTTEAEDIPETTDADDECPEDPVETTLADEDPETTENVQPTEPETTEKPVPTTTTKKPAFCQGKPNGQYPNPEDCSSYYKCTSGYTRLIDCPPDNYFDPDTVTCVEDIAVCDK